MYLLDLCKCSEEEIEILKVDINTLIYSVGNIKKYIDINKNQLSPSPTPQPSPVAIKRIFSFE